MRRKSLLVCLFAAVTCSWMPVKDQFTPKEMQSISVETPGLFDRSEVFNIDFTELREKEYSFPMPVGKAVLMENKSDLKITSVKGDAVRAMFDGVVRLSRKNHPFGNVVVVRHDNGLETVYGYNAQNMVKVGDHVKAGQTVAIVGGNTEEVFCIFSIMVNGRRINPETVIEVKSHRLRRQTLQCRREPNFIRVSVVESSIRPDMTEVDKIDFKANPFSKKNTIKWDLTQLGENEWCYPLPGAKVISPYGGKRRHSGVDLKTKPNDEIRAAFAGEVIFSGPYSGYGNCIRIRHLNGLETLYSHQSKNLVKAGQKVKAGDVIGLTGRTGRATTEHLHFEIKFQGRRYNPSFIYDYKERKLHPVVLTISQNGNVTKKAK